MQFSLAQHQTSQPIAIAAGTVVAVTPATGATALVEYTTGTFDQVNNGTASWTAWAFGTVSSYSRDSGTSTGFARITANSAAVLVDVHTNAEESNVAALIKDASGNGVGLGVVSGASGKARAPLPSASNNAILFGDSFSARNYNGAYPVLLPYRWMDYGYFTWAQILLGNPFSLVGNFGVPGDTTFGMLSRIDVAIAAGADWVFLEAGVNDPSSISPVISTADTIKNLKALCAKFTGAGARVVLMAVTPYLGTTNVPPVRTQTVNARMREWAMSQPGVTFVDTYSAWVNPTDTLGSMISSMSSDSPKLHPSVQGARAYGQAIANALAGRVPPRSYLPSSVAESYAIDATSSQILTNPLMVGNGAAPSGAGASGTLPASWSGGTDTGTVTSVFDLVARADGFGNDARATISAAGSGSVVNLRQTGLQSRFAMGDTVYAVGSITLTSMTDVKFITPIIDITIDGTNYKVVTLDSSGTTFDPTDITFNFRTPDFTLTGASLTSLSFFLKIGFGTSGTGAATLKIGRAGLYKY